MEKKFTKKDLYNAIIVLADAVVGDVDGITGADLKAFAEKEIAALERKALKAKETAAKKKNDADPIMDAVMAVLTDADDYLTIAQVTAAVNVEDYTSSKVQSRLTSLVKADKATSTDIKVGEKGKTRTIKAYKLITG